ncbi:hypothetical protein BH09GEM1_BH09GEM1_20740 [soil metagenome]
MRRAVILFPSGLTLFNLFFGIFAIITASRGDFYRAGVYVLLGGICDALDGRVARATNAGTQFGEELDSLVDAISFGLAPAMIMYFAVLDREGWQWVFVFAFAACAVLRLARFNIEQAGSAKTYFSGLPSPAAGCTLASYYWFSHSWLYNYGAIGNLPWQEMLRFLMAALAALMISPIPYPVFPRTGWRSKRALAGTVLLLTSGTLFLTNRLEFFFPLCLLYVAWGPLRWLISGLFERRQPTIPYDLSEGEDDEEDEDEDEEYELAAAKAAATRQIARDARLPRDDQSRRPRVLDDVVTKPARTNERPPRAERPQRTEEEIAARREKREKRDKREARPERAPRTPRPDSPVAALPETQPIPPTPVNTAIAISDPIDTAGAGAELDVVSSLVAGVDGAPPRKRKRRRRRGERKDRPVGDASAPQEGGGGDMENGDFDGDDGGDFNEGESSPRTASAERSTASDSPYSPTPPAPQSGNFNIASVSPAPAASPASQPETSSSPIPPSGPHE